MKYCGQDVVTFGSIQGSSVGKKTYSDGTVVYRDENGNLYRGDDGPTMIRHGTKIWWENGTISRKGGLPATIQQDGAREFLMRKTSA